LYGLDTVSRSSGKITAARSCPQDLSLPVLDAQAWHAAERLLVVGDQDHPARQSLTGDQDIVGTDRRPLLVTKDNVAKF
jgi:hypothetical protein